MSSQADDSRPSGDSAPTGDELSAAQWQAIHSLIAGHSIADVARAAQVHRVTVHRWLREEPFRWAYQDLRDEMFAGARAELECLAVQSIHAIRALADPVHRYGTSEMKVRVALALLKMTGLLRPVEDPEEAPAPKAAPPEVVAAHDPAAA